MCQQRTTSQSRPSMMPRPAVTTLPSSSCAVSRCSPSLCARQLLITAVDRRQGRCHQRLPVTHPAQTNRLHLSSAAKGPMLRCGFLLCGQDIHVCARQRLLAMLAIPTCAWIRCRSAPHVWAGDGQVQMTGGQPFPACSTASARSCLRSNRLPRW